jgi:hypothetical protein
MNILEKKEKKRKMIQVKIGGPLRLYCQKQ